MIKPMYWRWPTYKSIQKLASLLGLPYSEFMQDWEWEVADPNRIQEYFGLYDQGHMSDDDKFTLMETIIQAHEDKYVNTGLLPKSWQQVKKRILSNPKLHVKSVMYWACSNEFMGPQFAFKVSKQMREIQSKLGIRL